MAEQPVMTGDKSRASCCAQMILISHIFGQLQSTEPPISLGCEYQIYLMCHRIHHQPTLLFCFNNYIIQLNKVINQKHCKLIGGNLISNYNKRATKSLRNLQSIHSQCSHLLSGHRDTHSQRWDGHISRGEPTSILPIELNRYRCFSGTVFMRPFFNTNCNLIFQVGGTQLKYCMMYFSAVCVFVHDNSIKYVDDICGRINIFVKTKIAHTA